MTTAPPVPPTKTARPKLASTRAPVDSTSTQPVDFKLVSVALTDAFERLWKAGGIVLLALFIGTLLMVLPFIAATVRAGRRADAELDTSQFLILGTFGFGAVVVATVLVTALYMAVVRRRDVREKLRENGEMADALQSMALKVTEVTLQLQSLLLVNAQSVADMLVAAKPVLRLFGAEDIARQSNLNAQIVDTLQAARTIAEKAKAAIAASDPTPLLEYTEELTRLTHAVVAALKQPRAELEQLGGELQLNLNRLKQCVEDFCAGVDGVNTRALRYVKLVNVAGQMPLVGPFLRQRGLDAALDDGERLELMLNLTGAANHALASAIQTGRLADFVVAVEQISQLRALATPPADSQSAPA